MPLIRNKEIILSPGTDGNRWAMLVGINEYQDKHNYGNLSVCINDATKVRDALIAGGIAANRIHLLTDKTAVAPLKEEILAELQSVANATEQEDTLLFYFSGHGDEEQGESYLIPRNGKGIALQDTAIAMSRIQEIMQKAHAQKKVIIIDACHSGAAIGTKGSRPMPRAFIQNVFEEAKGMAILSACTQGELSHEWKEQHCSVFTYYFLEALQGRADTEQTGFVSVKNASNYVTYGVKQWASQRQVRQQPTLNYTVVGDIILTISIPQLSPSPTFQEEQVFLRSIQQYLQAVQKEVEKSIDVFDRKRVWIAHCQPLLHSFDQIDQRGVLDILPVLSQTGADYEAIGAKIYYINDQKEQVLSMINLFIKKSGPPKLLGERQKEIKTTFGTLLKEIQETDMLIASIEKQLQQDDRTQPYIGSWKSVRDGLVHQQLTNTFIDLGVQPKKDAQQPPEDMLVRLRKTPLHALFLYSSEDQSIHEYLTKHWGALDTLSENVCDIHPMLHQFQNAEDAYDYIKKIDVIRQSGFQAYSALPVLFFHDNKGNTAYIPFGSDPSEADIRRVIRVTFEEIHKAPGILSVVRARHILEDERDGPRETKNVFPHLIQEGEKPSPFPETYQILIDEVQSLPSGNGKEYEEVVKRVLTLCFSDEFKPFQLKEQVRTHNKKRVRDFIIDNRQPKAEFWQTMKIKNGVEKIIFDAKNYGNPVTYIEIISTLRYLKNKAFGNLMIIISRQGLHDFDEMVEDYGDNGTIIISLNDSDLIDMIKRKGMGESASSIIEEKYYAFLDMK